MVDSSESIWWSLLYGCRFSRHSSPEKEEHCRQRIDDLRSGGNSFCVFAVNGRQVESRDSFPVLWADGNISGTFTEERKPQVVSLAATVRLHGAVHLSFFMAAIFPNSISPLCRANLAFCKGWV